MSVKTRALQRQLELYKIFKMAIRAELRAQQMYQDAIANCDDQELKGILASLRDDEKRHEKELNEMYRELKQVIDMEESAASKPEPQRRVKAKRKMA